MSRRNTRNNLGPLTTTFTPPPDCSVFGYYASTITSVFFLGQYCYDGSLRDAATCRPPATVTTPNPPLLGWGLYSPGLYCPNGYVSACAATAGNQGANQYDFEFPLTAGETAVGCCPTGMTCNPTGAEQGCVSIKKTGTLYPAGYCGNGGPGYSYIDTVTIESNNYFRTDIPSYSSVYIFAPLIQRVFKASDLAAISSSTSASTSVPTNQSSSSSVPQDTGLSTGAKIGIGVGIPLAVLLVAALAMAIFLRRRKRSALAHQPTELPEKNAWAFRPPAEVHANQKRHELAPTSQQAPVEMSSTPFHHRSELPATNWDR